MKPGWEIKKLEEVAEYYNGLTYSPKDVSEKGTIVLRSSNIQNDELDFSDIVRVNVSIKEKLFVKEADILMCSRNGSQRLVGKTAPIFNLKEPMTFGTFMMIIRSEYSSYLLWYFKTDEFKKQISGGENTMINQVTRYMLDEIEIPLPPLPEQHRIVSILDKTFASIATAKANAEQNLKNAKELFESYLQGVFENKGEGWISTELMEVCEQITDGSHFSPKSSGEEEYPYITVRDIDEDVIDFDHCKFISKSDYKSLLKNGCKPYSGDLLFSKDGTVGKVSLVDYEKDFVVLSSLAIIRPKSKIITSILLKYILKNPAFLQTAIGMKTGVAIRRIILKNLKLIEISFPKSMKEQQSIVQKLDALSSETKKLEAIYQQKIVDLEELKKSVLQKAFNGEL